jgi:hypothetical protein
MQNALEVDDIGMSVYEHGSTVRSHDESHDMSGEAGEVARSHYSMCPLQTRQHPRCLCTSSHESKKQNKTKQTGGIVNQTISRTKIRTVRKKSSSMTIEKKNCDKTKQKQKRNVSIIAEPNQGPLMYYRDLINKGLGPNSKRLREVVNDDKGIENEKMSLEMLVLFISCPPNRVRKLLCNLRNFNYVAST